MYDKWYHVSAVIIAICVAIIVILSLSIRSTNNEATQSLVNIAQNMTQIIELRTEVDVLKGQMQVYINVPVDLRSRIEMLETRYDNLAFFQNVINRCEDNILNEGE